MYVCCGFTVWYFDSGASKHIILQCDMFTSFDSSPTGNSVTCANNSFYPVKGVDEVVLDATNGRSFILHDALYVPRIKKNLLLVSALTRMGLVMRFINDKCIVHDLSVGDTIVASGSLCHGLYRLNVL